MVQDVQVATREDPLRYWQRDWLQEESNLRAPILGGNSCDTSAKTAKSGGSISSDILGALRCLRNICK